VLLAQQLSHQRCPSRGTELTKRGAQLVGDRALRALANARHFSVASPFDEQSDDSTFGVGERSREFLVGSSIPNEPPLAFGVRERSHQRRTEFHATSSVGG